MTDNAAAQACGSGTAKGTCRSNGCDSSEVASEFYIATLTDVFGSEVYAKSFAEACSGGGTCCLPRGQGLCGFISSNQVDVKNQGLGSFSCVESCSGEALTKYAGAETCGGNQVCCAGGPPTDQPQPTAAPTGPAAAGSPTKLFNPLGEGTTLFTVARRIVQTFLGVMGAGALLVFIYAGILWMTAGSGDRVKKAQDTMKYAVLGLLIIMFAYGISVFVVSALGG